MLTRRVRSGWAIACLGAALVACTPSPGPTGDTPPVAPETAGAAGPSAAGSGGHDASMAAAGAIGQSGSTGSGGSTTADAAVDAPPATLPAPDALGPDPAPDAAGAPGGDASVRFACTRVLGIKQTGEWFSAGFETVVDNAGWEVVPVHNGHIELWADPMNAIWSQKPQSPCAAGTAPDRVIFVGTNYDYTTVGEFLPKYLAVIDNIKARFAAVKRIELQTHVRAPGNVACPGALDFKTTIKPAQDEALAQAVAKYPGFVVASPKFEVDSCADYGLYPHFKGGGAAAVGKKIGAHYRTP
jgi:hypothetical protein